MSRFRTQVEELKCTLTNTKISVIDRKQIIERIQNRQEILQRLDYLNKQKLKSIGAIDQDDERILTQPDDMMETEEDFEVMQESDDRKSLRAEVEQMDRQEREVREEMDAIIKKDGYAEM